MKKAIVILSGGQDSTTCLHWALREGFDVVMALTFAYSQKHAIEIACARLITEKNNVEHKVVDISFLKDFDTSSLTDFTQSTDLVEGRELPTTFVPNRNQLFITLAHSMAIKLGASYLITGVSQVDYSGYPDCRREFMDSLEQTLNLGTLKDIKILTPLVQLNKAQTFQLAEDLGVLQEIVEGTHTCYNGIRDFHEWGYGCGKCPACELREKGYKEFRDGNKV